MSVLHSRQGNVYFGKLFRVYKLGNSQVGSTILSKFSEKPRKTLLNARYFILY